MTTLVVCLYRDDLGDTRTPVVGRQAVEGFLTSAGVDDPENSRVNCMLEGIRLAEELDDGLVSVVTATGETVSGDRQIARQLEYLVGEYEPTSAVVVVDSAEDERLIPIVESRTKVDAVDRVVVRQARDIESTYYLLKQFLADEELRQTVLVPVGAALLAFPALLLIVESTTVAVGAIAAVVGIFLLYKGLSIDALLSRLSGSVREALYSGQVSLVTYVVAAGLAVVGVFAGLLGASGMDAAAVGELIVATRFVHNSIPWLTLAALTASAGRLLDGFIRDELAGSYVNLPFVAVAVGLAIRGFAAYLLQRSDLSRPLDIPGMAYGPIEVDAFTVTPETHLTGFVLGSIVVGLVGVRIASYVSSAGYDVTIDEQGTD